MVVDSVRLLATDVRLKISFRKGAAKGSGPALSGRAALEPLSRVPRLLRGGAGDVEPEPTDTGRGSTYGSVRLPRPWRVRRNEAPCFQPECGRCRRRARGLLRADRRSPEGDRPQTRRTPPSPRAGGRGGGGARVPGQLILEMSGRRRLGGEWRCGAEAPRRAGPARMRDVFAVGRPPGTLRPIS